MQSGGTIIFSVSTDESTNDVICWLNKFQTKIIRLNENFLTEEENDTFFIVRNYIQKNSDLNSHVAIWFWKNMNLSNIYGGNTDNTLELESINKEYLSLKHGMIKTLHASKKSIGAVDMSVSNKIFQLDMFKKYGLKTPDTIITTSKRELISFKKKHRKIITKCIGDVAFIKYNNATYTQYARLISSKTLNSTPDSFFYSLFQEYIEKVYEIRSVFLNGKFYSSAIFSQKDKTTKVDYRKYNHKKPNRVVPFILPKSVEAKLSNLLSEIKVNFASIDIIKTPNDEYYILELNPSGQFGMVSDNCNYFIEKQIAIFLSHEQSKKN